MDKLSTFYMLIFRRQRKLSTILPLHPRPTSGAGPPTNGRRSLLAERRSGALRTEAPPESVSSSSKKRNPLIPLFKERSLTRTIKSGVSPPDDDQRASPFGIPRSPLGRPGGLRFGGKAPFPSPPGDGIASWLGRLVKGLSRHILPSLSLRSGIPRFPLTSVEAESSSAGIPYLFPFKEGGLNGDVEALQKNITFFLKGVDCIT